MSITFDPEKQFESEKEFIIPGRVLNEISDSILELRRRIKDLQEENIYGELEMLRIRDKNPAVKDAWDKYQTVLNLARKD